MIPTINLSLSAPHTPTQLVTTLNVVLVLTLLVLAPSLILVMTSFIRLIVVFSFLRTALGTQQTPHADFGVFGIDFDLFYHGARR
ncbi:hypothetical protein ASB1_07520 [Helicobacter heilmannii]|nr:hypothetical protein ASB1_07520 [Helicobacter heilmannii]